MFRDFARDYKKFFDVRSMCASNRCANRRSRASGGDGCSCGGHSPAKYKSTITNRRVQKLSIVVIVVVVVVVAVIVAETALDTNGGGHICNLSSRVRAPIR